MKLAIASLICSFVSIFIFWWLGIVGVFLGITAVCRYDGDIGERGLAPWICLIGVLMGAVTTALYLVPYLS